MADSHRLYACYLQATRERGNGDIEREQWVVFPPSRARHADQMLTFSRVQRKPSHKAVWNAAIRASEDTAGVIKAAMSRYEASGWMLSPIITVQVTHVELDVAFADRKTPWKALNRVTRVAKNRHGLAI